MFGFLVLATAYVTIGLPIKLISHGISSAKERQFAERSLRNYEEDFAMIARLEQIIKTLKGNRNYKEREKVKNELDNLIKKVTLQKMYDCEKRQIQRWQIERILSEEKVPMNVEQIYQKLCNNYDLWKCHNEIRLSLNKMGISHTESGYYYL